MKRIKEGKMSLGEKDGVKMTDSSSSNNVTVGKKPSTNQKKCC